MSASTLDPRVIGTPTGRRLADVVLEPSRKVFRRRNSRSPKASRPHSTRSASSRRSGCVVVRKHCCGRHSPAISNCSTSATNAAPCSPRTRPVSPGRPVAVFTTTGPGLANALTGVLAARTRVPSRLVLLTAGTEAGPPGHPGTSGDTMPSGLLKPGRCSMTPLWIRRIRCRRSCAASRRAGAARRVRRASERAQPVQGEPGRRCPRRAPTPEPGLRQPLRGERSIELLSAEPFAIWVGFGARGAAPQSGAGRAPAPR